MSPEYFKRLPLLRYIVRVVGPALCEDQRRHKRDRVLLTNAFSKPNKILGFSFGPNFSVGNTNWEEQLCPREEAPIYLFWTDDQSLLANSDSHYCVTQRI
jgi:hypothetical protein